MYIPQQRGTARHASDRIQHIRRHHNNSRYTCARKTGACPGEPLPPFSYASALPLLRLCCWFARIPTPCCSSVLIILSLSPRTCLRFSHCLSVDLYAIMEVFVYNHPTASSSH